MFSLLFYITFCAAIWTFKRIKMGSTSFDSLNIVFTFYLNKIYKSVYLKRTQTKIKCKSLFLQQRERERISILVFFFL